MKFLIFILFPAIVFSQNTFTNFKDAEKAADSGFVTSTGWIIKKGDILQLGKGSMPDKSFAFFTGLPGSIVSMQNLSKYFNSGQVKIMELRVTGNKKNGIVLFVIAKPTNASGKYFIDIENAIDADEIIVPEPYAKKKPSDQQQVASKADELKKLKELLDSGVLTQEEFDAEKKKILENH